MEVSMMFNLVPLRFEALERNLFPDLFSDSFFSRPLAPFKTDIKEADKEYVLEAELPGYSKEDIAVEYNDGELTIAVNKEESSEDKNGNYLHKERRVGRMSRTFVFEDVNGDGIKAEFKDGVLKLSVPKLETVETKVKKIDIN
jgi:HSP20 family protein